MFARRLFAVASRSVPLIVRRSFHSVAQPLARTSPANRLVLGTGLAFATLAASKFSSSQSFIAQCADKVPLQGLPGTKNERTFIAVKPDGTQRGLIGDIISRFEKKGYKLVGIKILRPTEDHARAHYADLKAKPFFGGLVKFFSSGAVVAMVWEGKNVIKAGRKMMGATDPQASEPGSIRGDFCVEVGRNIIHGSDGPDSAQDEIKLWFKEDEVANWDRTIDSWVYEK
eukprot:TRINITY_DN139_c0_g1_i1.p1 TRINITY_DN139_c0_g1~~TRINITY_DN139_c0_g1_i1.p1  ORF type:complete len:228 (-),score=83.19 TRINITY_DN139_c0_g1_i1:91-774(-)